jgi:hypothetical protein
MTRLLRLIGLLLRPRNLLVIRRLFKNPQAQRAARAWQRSDSVSPWLPVAVPLLIWWFDRSFNREQAQMRQERAQMLKDEKRKYDQVERRFIREMLDDA